MCTASMNGCLHHEGALCRGSSLVCFVSKPPPTGGRPCPAQEMGVLGMAGRSRGRHPSVLTEALDMSKCISCGQVGAPAALRRCTQASDQAERGALGHSCALLLACSLPTPPSGAAAEPWPQHVCLPPSSDALLRCHTLQCAVMCPVGAISERAEWREVEDALDAKRKVGGGPGGPTLGTLEGCWAPALWCAHTRSA